MITLKSKMGFLLFSIAIIQSKFKTNSKGSVPGSLYMVQACSFKFSIFNL
jgi:hypothetical protein